MRNAQINHLENCTHAQTPAARRACRKAARAAAKAPVTIDACTLGKGNAVHKLVRYSDGQPMMAECGSGQYRGVRRPPVLLVIKGGVSPEAITCTKCAKTA